MHPLLSCWTARTAWPRVPAYNAIQRKTFSFDESGQVQHVHHGTPQGHSAEDASRGEMRERLDLLSIGYMLAATHSYGAAVRFAVLVCSHCIVLRQGVVPTA
jgi:hypothetical protein